MNDHFTPPIVPISRGIPYRLLAFAFRHPVIVAFAFIAISLFVYVIVPLFFLRWEDLLMVERLIAMIPLILGGCLLLLLARSRMLLTRRIDRLLRQATEVCHDRIHFSSTFPYYLGRHSQTPISDAPVPDDSATLARVLQTLEATRAVNRKGISHDLEQRLLQAYREIHALSGFRDAQSEALKSLLTRALTYFYFVRHDLDAFWHAISQTRKHHFRQQELVIFRERLPEAPLPTPR